jgi:signal transduction histidine kinase
MTIQAKLTWTYVLFAGIVLLASGVSLYMFQQVGAAFEHVTETAAPMLNSVHEIEGESLVGSLQATSHVLSNVVSLQSGVGEKELEKKNEAALAKFNESVAQATRHLDAYESRIIDTNETALAVELREVLEVSAEDCRNIMARSLSAIDAEEMEKLQHAVGALEEQKFLLLTLMIEKELEELKESQERVALYTSNAFATSILVWFTTILLALVLGRVISRSIAVPIHRLRVATIDFGRGQLDRRVKVESNDEIGELGHVLNQMAEDFEEEVEHREKLAVELLRHERMAALGTLISTVSHEIRNPLGTIRTSLHTMRKRLGEETGTLDQTMDRAERGINRCDTIIGELLDYTRTPQLDSTPVHLDDWLTAILDDLEISERITVTRDLKAGVEVVIDSERLRGCVLNIIENACHAMLERNDEDASCDLQIQTWCEEGNVRIRITDTGPGVPVENLEKVFEPMFTTRNFGVGLGLSIVKKNIEQHGGGIEITSAIGRGTSMTLWLPAPAVAEV